MTATHDPSEALAFSDSILMLNKNGNVEAYGSPEEIYSSKKNQYMAGFFDEVTEINGRIYYPHELLIKETGGISSVVTACYFRGDHYLVQAESSEGLLFLNSSEPLSEGTQISVKPRAES